jgi:hypothetical protein
MNASGLVAALAILGIGMAPADGNAAEAMPPVKRSSQRVESAPAGPQADAAQAQVKEADVELAGSTPGAVEPTKDPGPAARVDLDATQITGNRELPRVLYVVPWKRADLGEMSGKPAKSLLDEVLAPVDRDVFKRQNRYHDALQTEAAAPVADAPKGER